MNSNPLQKIATSSTAWFGVISAALSTWATSAALPLPPWLAPVAVLAYGLKEAASKLASTPTPTQTQGRHAQDAAVGTALGTTTGGTP